MDELNAYILGNVSGERRFVLNNRSVHVNDTQSLYIVGSSQKQPTELTVVRDDDDDQEGFSPRRQQLMSRLQQGFDEQPTFDYDFDIEREMAERSKIPLRNSVSSIKSNPYLIVTPIKRLGPNKMMSGLASTQMAALSDQGGNEQELLARDLNHECQSACTQ